MFTVACSLCMWRVHYACGVFTVYVNYTSYFLLKRMNVSLIMEDVKGPALIPTPPMCVAVGAASS